MITVAATTGVGVACVTTTGLTHHCGIFERLTYLVYGSCVPAGIPDVIVAL